MAECWCGKNHDKSDAINGKMKHFVLNWQLYRMRKEDIQRGNGKEGEVQVLLPALPGTLCDGEGAV